MSENIQGRCPVCGNNGADAPAEDLNTGFQSTSDLDTTGNGVPLEYYKGELMCEACAKRLQSDEESLRSAEKHEQTQEFLSSVGTRQTVEE